MMQQPPCLSGKDHTVSGNDSVTAGLNSIPKEYLSFSYCENQASCILLVFHLKCRAIKKRASTPTDSP